MIRMTKSRFVPLLFTGMLGACISLASTLPDAVSQPGEDAMESVQAALLPGMMDASASFANTGSSSPATVSTSPFQARSGGLSGVADVADTRDRPDNMGSGCVPEPVSMLLTMGGLLGIIAVRRFGGRALQPVPSPLQRHDL
jgi:hypothetical protein